MLYVFYNPKKENKILGMSTDASSMEFPCVETSENYHSTSALEIVMVDGVPTLKPKDTTIEKEIEKGDGFIRSREMRRTATDVAKEDLKSKLSKGEIKKLEDLLPLLSKIL